MLFTRKYVYEEELLQLWQLNDGNDDLKKNKISILKNEIKSVEKLVDYEISSHIDNVHSNPYLSANEYETKPYEEVTEEKPIDKFLLRESTSLFSNHVKCEVVYTCPLCEHVFSNKYSLKKHKRKHNICQYCKSKFKTIKAVESHKKNCIFKNCMTSRPYVKVSNIAYSNKIRSLYHLAFEKTRFPFHSNSLVKEVSTSDNSTGKIQENYNLTIKSEPPDMEYEEIISNGFNYFDKNSVVKSEPIDTIEEPIQYYACSENVKKEYYSDSNVYEDDHMKEVNSHSNLSVHQAELPLICDVKIKKSFNDSKDTVSCSESEEYDANQRFSRFKSEVEEITSQVEVSSENILLKGLDQEIPEKKLKKDQESDSCSSNNIVTTHIAPLLNAFTKIESTHILIKRCDDNISLPKKSIKQPVSVNNVSSLKSITSQIKSLPNVAPKCLKHEKIRYVRFTNIPNMNLFLP